MREDQKQPQVLHVVEIGQARVALFEELARQREIYGKAGTPQETRNAWIEILAAVHRFLNALEPPGDELHTLTMLGAALEDLNDGTQADALKPARKAKGGRGPIPREEFAKLAAASAAVDIGMSSGLNFGESVSQVSHAVSVTAARLKSFRRNIHNYGDEAVQIRDRSKILFEEFSLAHNLTGVPKFSGVLQILRQSQR